MSTNTPGSYTVKDGGNCQFTIYAGETAIARVYGYLESSDEPRANADRICRAVNAHDDLLAALRKLAEIGEGGVVERRETGKPTWYALDVVAHIALAAIAQATT